MAVLPDNVTQERRQLLELYGAKIIYSDGTLGSNGAVRLAKKIAEEDSRYIMLYQYGNEANPRAHYYGTAPEIIRDLPDISVLVAGLGTGGTLTGSARRLKEYNPSIKLSRLSHYRATLCRACAVWKMALCLLCSINRF